jgi:hypothetical protein
LPNPARATATLASAERGYQARRLEQPLEAGRSQAQHRLTEGHHQIGHETSEYRSQEAESRKARKQEAETKKPETRN